MEAMPDTQRIKKIRDRLDEFDSELEKSDDLGDQFQVGYYVNADDIRWLLDMLGPCCDDCGKETK